ncbi:MAG: antibiotic biosynthesis monooxygenase family protein [Thermomicrobium sp.]|nr:antibiotic biosynthesis monooxygenase family protein [Thermomicrobium sp.]
MFIDLSFFEVADGMQPEFERSFRVLIAAARQADGCLSSELVRLDEEQRYVWVERWSSREAHNAFNERLFGELLPRMPDLERYARRLTDRDAEGYVVI